MPPNLPLPMTMLPPLRMGMTICYEVVLVLGGTITGSSLPYQPAQPQPSYGAYGAAVEEETEKKRPKLYADRGASTTLALLNVKPSQPLRKRIQ